MKRVFFLTVALLMLALPAFAGIDGTKHDLVGPDAGTNDELCVYCHTPHGADISVTKAPLWNRTNVDATSVYAGLDLEAALVLANVNATDAPLCLSCHNGAGLNGALKNPPNGKTIDLSLYAWGSAAANLGADLNNDHPIGFSYATHQTTDAGLDTKANAEADLGAGALSYGSGNDMWCSSCHDVHDNTAAPFLRISNANSALCLACHIK